MRPIYSLIAVLLLLAAPAQGADFTGALSPAELAAVFPGADGSGKSVV